MTVIKELFVFLGLETDEAAIKKADDALESLEGRMGSLVKTAAAVTVGLSALAGALVVNTIATVRAGEAAQETADKLGITAEEVQEYGHVAAMSGTSSDVLTAAVGKLNRVLGDAQQGSKTAQASFRALGVSLKDANGRARPTAEVFDEVVGRLSQIPNVAERTSKAVDILGKSASELAGLFLAGADGISDLRQEARDLGIVISNENAAAYAEMADDLDLLEATVLGVFRAIGAELAPTLGDNIKLLQQWLMANREVIRTKVAPFLKSFAEGIAGLLRQGLKWLGWMRDAIEFLGGLKRVAQALGVLVGGVLAYQLGAAAVAMWGFQAATLAASGGLLKFVGSAALAAAGPLALGLALVVVGLALEDFITAVQGGDSLIGRFINKFLTDEDPSDSFLVKALRLIAYTLKLAVDSTREFFNLWSDDSNVAAKAQRYWLHFWDPVLDYWGEVVSSWFTETLPSLAKVGFKIVTGSYLRQGAGAILGIGDGAPPTIPPPSFGGGFGGLSTPGGGSSQSYQTQNQVNLTVQGDMTREVADDVLQSIDETLWRQASSEAY